jgi:hypothetical protein
VLPVSGSFSEAKREHQARRAQQRRGSLARPRPACPRGYTHGTTR